MAKTPGALPRGRTHIFRLEGEADGERFILECRGEHIEKGFPECQVRNREQEIRMEKVMKRW
ncbi:MAG: hypothetical protein ACUVWX_04275 [Kiritimatiellia bacterium]